MICLRLLLLLSSFFLSLFHLSRSLFSQGDVKSEKKRQKFLFRLKKRFLSLSSFIVAARERFCSSSFLLSCDDSLSLFVYPLSPFSGLSSGVCTPEMTTPNEYDWSVPWVGASFPCITIVFFLSSSPYRSRFSFFIVFCSSFLLIYLVEFFFCRLPFFFSPGILLLFSFCVPSWAECSSFLLVSAFLSFFFAWGFVSFFFRTSCKMIISLKSQVKCSRPCSEGILEKTGKKTRGVAEKRDDFLYEWCSSFFFFFLFFFLFFFFFLAFLSILVFALSSPPGRWPYRREKRGEFLSLVCCS